MAKKSPQDQAAAKAQALLKQAKEGKQIDKDEAVKAAAALSATSVPTPDNK